MILFWLIVVLLAGGVVAALVERLDRRLPRAVALAALIIDLFLMIPPVLSLKSGPAGWLYEFDVQWIPQLGIRFHLAMDGLSMLLVLLTLLLGIPALVGSWSRIEDKRGFFHLNVLWTLAGVTGVFLAMDLFLFYFFWELMLFPMYFLIAIWGHEDRFRASVKFFLFTQLSGLLMLMAIIGLYFVHGRVTGIYTFAYAELLSTPMSGLTSILLASGFLIAFLVKLPAVPFHTWLPDAHTQAPTAGSVILAGLLLKTGAYGLLRFVVPLFPSASSQLSPLMMVLAVISILYGGLLVFAQNDVKRLVAYTSVSHMGFVLLGTFSRNELALQGAVIMIICHALSTGALFMLVGVVQAQLGTRDLERMGGLWRAAPRLGGVWLFFALASLGLPGLGNFIGEFMVLLGAWAVNRTAAIFGAIGFVVATIYALWMVHRILFGQERERVRIFDLVPAEMVTLGVMIAALVWIGLYPQPILNVSKQWLTKGIGQGAGGTEASNPTDRTDRSNQSDPKRIKASPDALFPLPSALKVADAH